jgi:hypothetical protein
LILLYLLRSLIRNELFVRLQNGPYSFFLKVLKIGNNSTVVKTVKMALPKALSSPNLQGTFE